MTDLEKDSFALFVKIRDAWTRRLITKWEFRELLGDIVKIIRRFDSTQSGCPTGKHYEECTCQAAVAGYARKYQPRRTA